eukprot:PITA_28988
MSEALINRLKREHGRPVIQNETPQDTTRNDVRRDLEKVRFPKFQGSTDGQSAEAWLENMAMCFTLRDYTSNMKAKMEEFLERQLNEFNSLKQGSRSLPQYEARFMEFLRYAPHLNTEKLKVNKFVYGLNVNIRTMVRILMPRTLHEAVQRAIIAEEEIMSSEHSKSTRPTESGVPGMERTNWQGGPALNHQKWSRRNQRTPYRHPAQHPRRAPQQACQPPPHRPMRQHQVTPPQHQSSFQQSFRPVHSSVGSRSQVPRKGCWTCGGPHYERDCPQKTGNTNSIKNATTVEDLGKAHHIQVVVNNHQVKHQSTVLETSGNIDGMSFVILIDPGATDSFISINALSLIKHKATPQYEFKHVEMACGMNRNVGKMVKDCKVDLGVCKTKVSLYSTILGGYDVVLGMDWLERHEALLDCKDKILHFTDYDGLRKSLRGRNRGVSLRFISSMQLMKFRRKGCQLFSVVTLNEKSDSEDFEKHPFLVEFKDVFPEELPGLPPKREIDFTIDLKPGTEPIAKAPFRMSAVEIKELQIQLKELLDLGFIRPSISPWGAPVIFVKKRMGLGDYPLITAS